MSHNSGWSLALLALACSEPDTATDGKPAMPANPTLTSNRKPDSPSPEPADPMGPAISTQPERPSGLPTRNEPLPSTVSSMSPAPSPPAPSPSLPASAPTTPPDAPEPTAVDAGSPGTPSGGECETQLPLDDLPSFDCGDAHIMEDHGPPSNRVNYVIVADGYVESELDTALLEHVENMLYNEETGMFSEIGQPYTRYRNFINVCVMRTASNESGVDGPNGNPDRDTMFDGGNCGDRLGCVDDNAVLSFLGTALPEHVDADWVAATMNENEWWNSGGRLMVWSGKFMETSATQAASVALHEGGHAFHGLADEYADDNLDCDCGRAREPNVACETSEGLEAETKWGEWLGFVMEGGSRLWNLGEHGAVPGGRYCGQNSGVTRPTRDSEMNLLPYAHNMPSIQKIIHDIYGVVRPIDAHTPNERPVVNATELAVRVVDPEVIELTWSVDGEEVPPSESECFSLEGLTTGEHTVSVRAHDETDWVRDSRDDLEQSVEWTVIVP